jgi:ATP-dependent RNA helicase DDX54/DBP10
VVTDLASRGIDLPFVENVIHFDYAATTRIFIHRSGRTARAGRTGRIYALMNLSELGYLSELLAHIGRKVSYEAMPDVAASTPESKNSVRNTFAICGSIPTQLLGETMDTI